MRPELGEDEIKEVIDTLPSGWLMTGPKVKRFETDFAQAVRGTHAIVLNSWTAALHLGALALGLRAGQAVLVPTMTFAATAEIVQYTGAIPILVDCEPDTGNMDSLRDFANRHGLWILEDAAHSFPSAWRRDAGSDWIFCRENTVSCFSFYANKTITTGEGGMAVTEDEAIAERIRLLSLHGLSRDAWTDFPEPGPWDYQIVAAGYKYNLTDIAAAIGIHQVAAAEVMRIKREIVARAAAGSSFDRPQRVHRSVARIQDWILGPLAAAPSSPALSGTFRSDSEDFPVATALWPRLISLPIFPSMTTREINRVIAAVREICAKYSVSRGMPAV